MIAAFRPLDPSEVVLGQYAAYRQTEGIADDSTTDTYVAARLWIDTDRWRGVPFVLRTGKKLATSAQRVSLIFRPAEGPLHSTGAYPNVLAFDLKGNGAIEIEMTVKKPGPEPVPAESLTRLNLENVAEGVDGAVHLAALRRPHREPVAVHHWRAGRGLPGLPAAARLPAPSASRPTTTTAWVRRPRTRLGSTGSDRRLARRTRRRAEPGEEPPRRLL